MRKLLSIVLFVISGLCAVAVLGVWARSYWVLDRLYCAEYSLQDIPHGWMWSISSAQGTLEVILAGDFPGKATLAGLDWGYERHATGRLMFGSLPARRAWEQLGFRVTRLVPALPSRGLVINCPHWFLFGLFSVFPLWKSWRFWSYRARVKRGLCPGCGYDLHGNLSGQCPECGRKAPSPLCGEGFPKKSSA